jgi:hypothetical protein
LQCGVAGGSLDDASCTVTLGLAKPEDFKFFHGEIFFEGGQLEKLFYEGLWDLLDTDCDQVLFDGSVAAPG